MNSYELKLRMKIINEVIQRMNDLKDEHQTPIDNFNLATHVKHANMIAPSLHNVVDDNIIRGKLNDVEEDIKKFNTRKARFQQKNEQKKLVEQELPQVKAKMDAAVSSATTVKQEQQNTVSTLDMLKQRIEGSVA